MTVEAAGGGSLGVYATVFRYAVDVGTRLSRGGDWMLGRSQQRAARQFVGQTLTQIRAERGGTPADQPTSAATSQPVIIYDLPPGRDYWAARRRRGGGPGYRPSWWKKRGKPTTWEECIRWSDKTDTAVERCDELFGKVWSRGPIPPVIPKVPSVPDLVTKRAVTLGRVITVLGRVAGVVPYIFWPSRTADDDTVPGPMPSPQRIPTRGPTRRPVVVRSPPPRRVYYPQQPRFPDDYRRPGDKPDTVTQPAPRDRPQPAPRPRPLPTEQPRPTPRPTPRPAPRPAPPRTAPKLPDLWPLLAPMMQPKPQKIPRPNIRALTDDRTRPLDFPAPTPYQVRPANCPPCEQTRNRKKRNQCTNPVTRKREFTRAGAKYRTITRKLEC